ncbi:MAG: lipopolysaccharide transport periplasmic protein LptA [Vibrio sp.]
MKRTHLKKLANLSLLLCMLIPAASWALTSDKEQPIYIDSDQQDLDMNTNKVIFTGNVKLTQGSILVTADKIIAFRDGKTGKLTEIQGYGKPTHFQQKTDDGKLMKGQGNKAVYTVSTDLLVLTDDAEVHQDGSNVKGKVITYHMGTQKLTADGGSGKRVSTVILPAELDQK